MLVLLPLGAWAGLFLALAGAISERTGGQSNWRQAFLQASAVWGAAVGLTSEGLSLFQALSRLWVAVLWAAVILSLLGLPGSRRHIRAAASQLPRNASALSDADRTTKFGLVGIVSLLFLVAYVSPPNNTDSLLYHMSRVAHWAQNRSLRHYPTQFEPQLWNSLWAEEAILQLKLTWGGDRPANLVQWFAMVGSLMGVSATAGLLGGNRKVQLAAAAFTVSVPMGALQATSTQNDYATAFWLVSFAYFVVLAGRRPLRPDEQVCMLLAFGVGCLTKGTFCAFGLPFAAWYARTVFRRHGAGSSVRQVALLAGAALLFNAGLWARNVATFGGPLGSDRIVAERTNLRDPSLGRWAAVLVANSSLNLATPLDRATEYVEGIVLRLYALLGVDPDDYRLVSLWNHEDVAGSPLHLALILATTVLVFRSSRTEEWWLSLQYVLALLAGYVLHAVLLDWQPYGSRFQLPFFSTWGAVVATVVSAWAGERMVTWFSRGLLLLALPWVLFNRTRPVIGIPPWTMTGSVFTISREEVLFASWPGLRAPLTGAVNRIEASECREVGLRIDSHDPEYMLWWLLGAPENGVRIESVYTYPHLERYVDPYFRPCAIVCTICEGRAELNGLPLAARTGTTSLYMFGADSAESADD